MPKFSIIIPVYKSEKYLVACIESILVQTFRDFELILVDDGSPDNCGKICDSYAESDSRIKVIHKANGGVSSARNAGLDTANGEYIVFVDSDDSISANYLEGFLEHRCDIIICGFNRCFENGMRIAYNESHFVKESMSNQYLLELLETEKMFTVWGKAFKKSLIEQSDDLRFRLDMSYGEDTVFTMSLFKICNSIGFTEKALYNYNKYNGETLTSVLTEKSLFSFFEYDKFVERWLCELNMKSNIFRSSEFPTKSKIKWAFYKIFDDKQLTLSEKRKWYEMFLKNSIFCKNIDILFPEMSKTIKFVLKMRSPSLLLFYQFLSSKKHNLTR